MALSHGWVTAVVSSHTTAARAAATVRTAPGATVVLDLNGTYVKVADERVVGPSDVGLDPHEVAVRRVVLDATALERWTRPCLVRHLLGAKPAVLSVRPGVLLRSGIADLVQAAHREGVALVARGSVVDDGRWPTVSDVLTDGSYVASVVGVASRAAAFVADWEQMAADDTDRWLDVLAARHRHYVERDEVVVSAWSRSSDLSSAAAVDLSMLDSSSPWLLDPRATTTPRIRLSDDPRLASVVAAFLDDVGTDVPPPPVSSLGIAVQPHLEALISSALAEGRPAHSIPDVFAAAEADALAAWLAELATTSAPAGRLLAEVFDARPELRQAFPNLAGSDGPALAAWADGVGLADLAGAHAPPSAAKATPRSEGVNVIGYLSGELGIGESARLMLGAIDAVDIPHSTVAVTKHLRSRQTAAYRAGSSDALFDTTLLCINAKETPSVSASVADVVKGTYRIGMWYWETEDFPKSQHKGFRHVDEVWVATEFIRSAIEPHSSVPVRTMMPALPQPGSHPDPFVARLRLGLPDRPILLFAFDYASIAERKNPWGLVDAFEAAFAPGEGPLLVIKSISGDRNPAQAERLRLRVAGSPDVRLIEDYLDADDRDALMAACDCYISLHRSEGLGLTMAEAMAMGKPVIATAYGGNLQFMTDQNSYLVPFERVDIPRGAGPYTPGATWADPDLDAAARLMQTVFEDLPLAAERGRRAAHDLRTKHSPQVAGRAVAYRLAEIRAQRAAASVPPSRSARSVAKRLLRR